MSYELKLYIDWDGDGDYLDAYEDVSAALARATVKRGRGAVTDQFAAGTATISIENPAGVYSPYNESSPLYGLMLPGRAAKLEAVIDAATIRSSPGTSPTTASRRTRSRRSPRWT